MGGGGRWCRFLRGDCCFRLKDQESLRREVQEEENGLGDHFRDHGIDPQIAREQPDACVGCRSAGQHQQQVFRQDGAVALVRVENRAPDQRVIERQTEQPSQHLRAENISALAIGEVKDQAVEQRGQQRNRTKAQQDEIDLHRVHDGVEVRRLVARLVDGTDGLLRHWSGKLMRGQQHLHLEFVAVCFEFQDAQRKRCRNAPQAGLGVAQLASHQGVHHSAGEDVAEAAPQRDVAMERTAAEHQTARIGQ